MSFQQGLSGLSASSKALDTIGNNIANSSTVGFKLSTAQFADVFAASLAGAGASPDRPGRQGGRGGTAIHPGQHLRHQQSRSTWPSTAAVSSGCRMPTATRSIAATASSSWTRMATSSMPRAQQLMGYRGRCQRRREPAAGAVAHVRPGPQFRCDAPGHRRQHRRYRHRRPTSTWIPAKPRPPWRPSIACNAQTYNKFDCGDGLRQPGQPARLHDVFRQGQRGQRMPGMSTPR